MKSNFKLNKVALTIAVLAMAGCNSGSSKDDSDPSASYVSQTAPSIPVTISNAYKEENQAGYQVYSSRTTQQDWQYMTTKYQENLDGYQKMGKSLQKANQEGDSYPDFYELEDYNANTVYATAGNTVVYTDGSRYGVFTNKWWTQGNQPNFDSQDGPWTLIVRVDQNGNYLTKEEATDVWVNSAVYNSGDTVSYDGHYFEAKYWTKGDTPILTQSSGGTAADWSTPWKYVGEDLEDGSETVTPNPVEPTPPACTDDCVDPEIPDGSVVIDPVVPTEPDTGTDNGTTDGTDNGTLEPVEPITPPDVGDNGLPDEGYAFLREMTAEHWDWMFPMRSGRYNPNGDFRNMPPYAAADGSLDTFKFENFKKAVVEYNTWAQANGYKQFLNEGTKEQQALEFVTFWAKSARETSGSWTGAGEPWSVNDPVAGQIWKGALYWIEEVGYTTNSDGTSPAINYVDAGSTAYPPAPGRSYYGRGVIQLSWNYNYGAFSYWLYDNGLMRDVITERDTLLKRPDYVATNGSLSILSGIWFWMTPQGAKPSSHDVMYGNMTHVSQSSQDQGLPQRNDGGTIPVAAGHSTRQDVIAYRLGTVINIVNGGLECNKAAAYHNGPLQRVSYYNGFAKYINHELNTNVTVIEDAVEKWGKADWVTPSSPENLKLATCYAQKSYYGW